ncbi:hypothetical protein DMUE_3884 [Dictyocoela muelleri]|nr:hypothetical protein DMUE_3884 [Dictyocoela muelleri]
MITALEMKILPFVFLKFTLNFLNKNYFTAKYVKENYELGKEMYARILSLIRSKIIIYVLINRREMGMISKEVQIYEISWARGNTMFVILVRLLDFWWCRIETENY